MSAEILPLQGFSDLISFVAFLISNNVACWKENLMIFLNLFLIFLILGWLRDLLMTMLSMISSILTKPVTFPSHLK